MALIYKNPHEQSRELASNELVSLESEEAKIQERLQWIKQRTQQLRAYLSAIAPLIENDPGQVLAEAGLTTMCREVLATSNKWMTAGEVRFKLAALGVSLSGYTNPMAVLHSILKRVGQAVRNGDGNVYYGGPNVVDDPPVAPPNKTPVPDYTDGLLSESKSVIQTATTVIGRRRKENTEEKK